MTESEYIDTINLAKLRTVAEILNGVITTKDENRPALAAVRKSVWDWIGQLEQVVGTDGSYSTRAAPTL